MSNGTETATARAIREARERIIRERNEFYAARVYARRIAEQFADPGTRAGMKIRTRAQRTVRALDELLEVYGNTIRPTASDEEREAR